MKFYAKDQLSEKQALTPEGFLLCESVPLARTGTMLYGPGETQIEPGPSGVVRITRDESEVFRPEFIASFAGKPVVNDHPSGDVNPDNWRDLSVGTVMNPRRGSGMQSDLLIADLIIQDANAIRLVRDEGKREVSCGYDADYEPTGIGEGRQLNMIGNHVALVDSGRCGPRCAIGDHSSITEGDLLMFTKDEAAGGGKAKKWWDTLKAQISGAVSPADKEKIEKLFDEQAPKGLTLDEKKGEEEEEGEHTHIHIHQGDAKTADEEKEEEKKKAEDARFKAYDAKFDTLTTSVDRISRHLGLDAGDKEIEGKLEEEAPAGTGDKARKAKDSTFMQDSFQETVALAEVLVPGIRLPTFDRASEPLKTYDTLCKLRRQALDLAYAQPEGRGMIEEIHGRPLELDKMECGAVRTLFRSAAAMKKRANNSSGTQDRTQQSAGGMGIKGPMRTPADLNKRNAEIYKS